MREDTMERLRQLQLEREHNRAILHPDAISHPVHQAGMPADAMLAVFQDRFTYTFLFQHEVSSIHFDRRRGEIFYRGHNIANLVLGDSQKRILQGLAKVLVGDPRTGAFQEAYLATLHKLLADK